MRLYLFLSAAYLLGCDNFTKFNEPLTTDGQVHDLGRCSSLPDLATPMAKCAAAKGLSGDNLICVNFSGTNAVQSLDALRAMQWIITKDQGSGQEQWEIAGGVLQIKNFASFTGSAGVTLPLADLSTSKYSSITLALRHKVDMDLGTTFPNQLAQIYFGTAIPAFLVTQTSGTQPEQQTIITIDKQKLPVSLGSMVKYLLQVQSGMGRGTNGWQIESIAVNASP